MAIIKNPLVRYQIIHECLSNKRKTYWSIEELIQKIRDRDIPVEKRTVERDIGRMRFDDILRYYAPIAYSKKNEGYHYTDPDFSIESFPLTTNDLDAIRAGTVLLEKYRGSRMLEGLEDLLKKAGSFFRQDTEPPIANEESPVYSSGLVHLDTIRHAIYEKKVLLITFTHLPQKITLHPYFLKEVKMKWHVAGLPEGALACRAFPLDKIAHVEDAALAYCENTMLDRELYFKYNYGAQPSAGQVFEIELWCKRDIIFLIINNPFHPEQRILEDAGDGILVSVKLIPTEEFLQELFIYGNSIDIRNPPILKSFWHRAINRANEDEHFLNS